MVPLRPNSPVSRAEIVALLNRSFGFSEAGTASLFADISKKDWFYQDVQIASQQGYIKGYPDQTFGPGKSVTRAELAAMIARLLQIDEPTTPRFVDNDAIPDWAKGAIGNAQHTGIMNGYADGSFQSNQTATRAETVVILDRSRQARDGNYTYRSEGVYGPNEGMLTLKGNVKVENSGITLQNIKIVGNLVLAKGIQEGDASLNHVIVEGTTTVEGGGENSIHILNSQLKSVMVRKESGSVRLAFGNNSSVGSMSIESNVTIDSQNDQEPVTINDVVINKRRNQNSNVNLIANIKTLRLVHPICN